MLAIWIGARPPDPERSFGYQRLEILAAVVNALLLFGVGAFILVEAIRRLASPPEVESGLMIAVALVGLAGNGASLWLLREAQSESLNVRGAYLEVLSDFAGAGAVIVAGLVIAATGVTTADAIASILIGLLIFPRTWRLLRDAVDVLLEATPKGLDMALVRSHILGGARRDRVSRPPRLDDHLGHERRLGPCDRRAGRSPGRGARSPVRVSRWLLRHRAQHVPDRDRGSATTRRRRARVTTVSRDHDDLEPRVGRAGRGHRVRGQRARRDVPHPRRHGDRVRGLVADGYHARTDGLTSLAVVLGAGGVWLGYPRADPIVGLLITVAILWVLKGAAVQVFGRLMDAVDPALVGQIATVASSTASVQSIEDVRVRWIGHRLEASLHAVVDCDWTVAKATRSRGGAA